MRGMVGTMNTILDDLARLNPDAFLFEPRDRYDRCVVAVARHHTGDRWAEARSSTEDAPYVAVYDYEALVHAVSEDFGAGEDQEGGWDAAAEWVDFNMAGGWLGPNTPIVVDNADVVER